MTLELNADQLAELVQRHRSVVRRTLRQYTGDDEELADWAKRLTDLAANLKTVYIYFNNDAEAFAVRNAVTLRDCLKTEQELKGDKVDKP